MKSPHLLVLCLCCALPTTTLAAAEPQAAVENPVKESDLTKVILTTEAEMRLGIVLKPAVTKSLPAERVYPGEIVFPMAGGTGSLIAIAPPQTPTEMLKFADQQAVADGDVAQTEVRKTAARTNLERTEKMFAGQTSSQKVVDEARSAFDLAAAALTQAVTRRALLGPNLTGGARNESWWVRVVLPAADASGIEPKSSARIRPLGATAGFTPLSASRVEDAPTPANAAGATIDWFYNLPQSAHSFRPGERVEIRIQLAGSGDEKSVVPWAAVLHDISGGQWVYENTAPRTYARRRVQVLRVIGDDAVLATGPPPGAQLVTDGAAELFGIEFGPGK